MHVTATAGSRHHFCFCRNAFQQTSLASQANFSNIVALYSQSLESLLVRAFNAFEPVVHQTTFKFMCMH